MYYTVFKSLFTHTLSEAGLIDPAAHPSETIDLESTDRCYSIRLGLGGRQSAEPFTVTCKLSWRWDALQTARTATTEEDLLTELHGRDEAADMDTERPWLWVDLKFSATLPWGESSTLPNKSTWRQFVADVTEKIALLFPVEEVDLKEGTTVLGWCGEPVAHVQCEADGELLLSSVELEAWQAVLLPRRWDDPEKEPDHGPEGELAALAGRVRDAMMRWDEAVRVLVIVGVGLN